VLPVGNLNARLRQLNLEVGERKKKADPAKMVQAELRSEVEQVTLDFKSTNIKNYDYIHQL